MYIRSDRSIVMAIVMMLCMTVTSFAGADAGDSDPVMDDKDTRAVYEVACEEDGGVQDIGSPLHLQQEDRDIVEDMGYEVLQQDGVIYRVSGNGSIEVTQERISYEPGKGHCLEAIYITGPGEDAEDVELCRDLLIHPSFEEGTVITFCFERSEQDTMRTDESSRAIYDGVWDESSGAVSQGGGND